MEQVTLLDGIFKKSQETGKQYLLQLDVDRLLAPCYEAAKLKPKKPRYGGWEKTQIAGHSIGHWLSAVSTMYAVTGDKPLLQRLDYALNELAYVQSHDPDGYVSGFPRDCFDKAFTGEFEVDHFNLGGSWVPWYSIHKIYAGLIDAYIMTDHELALNIVKKLADWAVTGTSGLTDEQFQKMLICEHGGMNEVMAELYRITGEQAYLDLAVRFCHQAILEPLSRRIDELEGKHANTQIPKVIGAAKLYDITGEPKYRTIAEFFWQVVTRKRSYIIGGNSNFEHFSAPNTEQIGVETAETCNTYNMLKLTSHLFRWSPNAEYMDFYERALFNHILSSQEPETGMKMYFISTEPGHFKVYGTLDDSFWCCTGTGMENPARYTHHIYHADANGIYVNLFISSIAKFGDRKLTIRQETLFPESDRTKLTMEDADHESVKLRIRVPYWIAGEMKAVVNGEHVYTRAENGYLEIERSWNKGDTVEVTFPMDLHLYRAKDDGSKVGIMYGPIVLAGALGRANFPETDVVGNHLSLHHHPLIDVPVLVTDDPDPKSWIKRAGDSALTFVSDPIGQPGDQRITFIPFYKLHHQRYTIYWKLLNKAEYKNYADHEKIERERLNAITVDTVNPYEQQSEVEHRIRSERSRSGYSAFAKRGYRDAVNGYFSYRVTVLPNKPMAVQVTYSGNEGPSFVDGVRLERHFHISIDGEIIASEKLDRKRPHQLFEVLYPIPSELTKGKHQVELKFASEINQIAGSVYGIRIIDLSAMR